MKTLYLIETSLSFAYYVPTTHRDFSNSMSFCQDGLLRAFKCIPTKIEISEIPLQGFKKIKIALDLFGMAQIHRPCFFLFDIKYGCLLSNQLEFARRLVDITKPFYVKGTE